ncbi:M20 family peptidase [Sneathiella marina]|uniref:M20 family peptidase n=1 Tax=Sneathiella marina TaxID=2950108 RepID=A0ABY4W4R1_9PROT|nr:M20 family peptidase [Sneathiella marina]USG61814.1 M20 family peptidase [Sneathiella marina]
MIKRILLGLIAVIIVIIGIVAFNTVTNNAEMTAEDPVSLSPIDTAAAAHRLSSAIKLKTISTSISDPPAADEFAALHALINQFFPLVAANLKREVVGDHSLLYTWQGSDQSLLPAMLLAHMDVVPVEPGTEDDWTYEAFSGAIEENAIWGRGALDDKFSVFAILEAAELQLAAGFSPKRTLYFAFGHDEELGGGRGAAKISALLESRGIQLAFTLDEGMVIVDGIMPGVEEPIAFIALAEKGYLTLKLTANAEGGHSSLPPRKTAIGKIARAVNRLEENRFPAALQSPASDMFDTLAPHMALPLKSIISNRWLLDPILISELGKGGATNAMVRTTTAVTIVEGGTKDNVLPTEAIAIVNFRLLPGTTIDDVVQHVKSVIDDPDISIDIKQGNEPSPISDPSAVGYKLIEKTIQQVFPDVLISPGLMLAGSDSKNYVNIADNSYRFIPLRFGKEDLSRIHGTNERILIDNYGEVIQFYRQLMTNVGG